MPRKAAKGKGQGRKAAPARGTAPRRRARTGSDRKLAQRVTDVVRGARDVGHENITPGRIQIGTTRRLTPTRAGFRALDRTLLAVQKAHAQGAPFAFTIDLNLRYRDARGRFVKPPTIKGAMLPRLDEVKRRRRKGETIAHAFRGIVESEIRSAIFRASRAALETNEPALARKLEAMSKKFRALIAAGNFKSARRLLARMKKLKDLSFRVSVHAVKP